MQRRPLMAAALGTAAAMLASRPARAQAWPSRPVRIIVPFAAGGATDILARALANRFGAEWPQPVVVENRTGAGGTIGTEAVAKSAPDGHVLLLGTSATQAITPHLYPSLSYDTVRDFAPISMVATVPMVLVVHPSVPARDVPALVQYAKANPGKLTFASSGQGAITHLASELFASQAGIQLTHVPYRGSAPAIADLLAGRVLMMIDHAPTVLPHIRSGGLLALGTAGPQRTPMLPEAPTLATSVPGVEVTSWFGLLAPAGTPAPVVTTVNEAVRRALTDQDVVARLREQGADAIANKPEAFTAFIIEDRNRWGGVVRGAGVNLG
ncbi:tripartite tricarboxylate transporter substrate binding protein [Roseomonas sp. SSH11]|uniref:Tripartite tricarboxylate transporter substrate binding protein n=1 Tax=Pararoseomonas baculiformis TaxID=2820812 RepID=A0ABS4AAV0_9PROT|nr:tripartite tricarboxylate transporter substrate binding protein [Pararoseomonas baculiformis]MBP0444134.1 tripartite tricarboxylate transporter substrate binding protein [Pararoseomonas baculiformis]